MGLSPPPTLLPARVGSHLAPNPVQWVEPHTAPSNARLHRAPEDCVMHSAVECRCQRVCMKAFRPGENRSHRADCRSTFLRKYLSLTPRPLPYSLLLVRLDCQSCTMSYSSRLRSSNFVIQPVLQASPVLPRIFKGTLTKRCIIVDNKGTGVHVHPQWIVSLPISYVFTILLLPLRPGRGQIFTVHFWAVGTLACPYQAFAIH